MEIKGYLENGKIRNISLNINDDEVYEDKKTGLKTIESSDINCGKCHGNLMCISIHYGCKIMFCANEACLKFDSDKTKEIELKKWIDKLDLYRKMG